MPSSGVAGGQCAQGRPECPLGDILRASASFHGINLVRSYHNILPRRISRIFEEQHAHMILPGI